MPLAFYWALTLAWFKDHQAVCLCSVAEGVLAELPHRTHSSTTRCARQMLSSHNLCKKRCNTMAATSYLHPPAESWPSSPPWAGLNIKAAGQTKVILLLNLSWLQSCTAGNAKPGI